MAVDKRNIKRICLNCFGTLDKSGFCRGCRTRIGDNEGSLLVLPRRTLLKGRYLVSKPLGIGGFGITYLAWDMQTSARVAVKEFFPKGYTTRSRKGCGVLVVQESYSGAFNHWLTAFVNEAKILTSINHLHGVVKLLDFFEGNGTAYIVMDFLEGVSLRQYLNARGGRIVLQEALNIMRPVLDSLFLLHQYGIIHKDISPENIIVVQNKFVKLIDFGAASIFTQNVVKPYIVLKAGYSPIELYDPDARQGPWSDVYQAGATLYNCITGAIPAEATARTPVDTLVRPSAFGVQIPPVVENCILRSMAVDPAARYDNMGKYIQTLYGEFLPRIPER
ncbi:MAG: serine/threonine protein kinase [Clostridiales bacterium]|jgi:serine/threonine protein kinase|nr:serine/threonine protein kinase [Clostridiales bacterium]